MPISENTRGALKIALIAILTTATCEAADARGDTPSGKLTNVASAPGVHEDKEAISKRYKKLVEKWTNTTFVPFANLGNDYLGFTLRPLRELDRTSVNAEREGKLNETVRYLLAALRSKSFQDYRRAVNGGHAIEPTISRRRLDGMKGELVREMFIDKESSLSDERAIEMLWNIKTEFGEPFDFYTSISPELSHYTASVISEPEKLSVDVVSSYNRAYEDQGIIQVDGSIFDYATDRFSCFKETGALLTATVYLHIRTATKGTPHPMVFRYMWAPKEREWIPMDYALLYLRKRYIPFL